MGGERRRVNRSQKKSQTTIFITVSDLCSGVLSETGSYLYNSPPQKFCIVSSPYERHFAENNA
jgi:hypothetical protein